jgi:FemAB-related protein (PEP-CTERM system-associated)
MNIHLAQDEMDARLWQDFVEGHPESSAYHRWGWKAVVENSFGWRTFYLMTSSEGQIQGILPLVLQKSWMFGSFLTSLPFVNRGGIIAHAQSAKDNLIAEAIVLAKRFRADYIEFRHRDNPNLELPARTHKVAMVLEVENNETKMWAALAHKVRTDIRKAIKSELSAEFGGQELLDDFYTVFAQNMRDLGTPVYSRKLFSEILRAFPHDTYVCIVRHRGRPIAGSFLIGYRNSLEAVWSSSLYSYSAMKPNMMLYWKILCFAGERGYRLFDFGRSSIGSGTHRFKKQWGAREVPLYWLYWVPEGSSLPEVNKENGRYGSAIWLWQRLPVALTKLVGPSIVKCLP